LGGQQGNGPPRWASKSGSKCLKRLLLENLQELPCSELGKIAAGWKFAILCRRTVGFVHRRCRPTVGRRPAEIT